MFLLNLTIRSGARAIRVMFAALPADDIVAILALLTVRGKNNFKRIGHGLFIVRAIMCALILAIEAVPLLTACA